MTSQGSPNFTVALHNPRIPPNTGNIGRTCVAVNASLEIVGKPAFSMDEKTLLRAGLDYWEKLNFCHYPDDTLYFNQLTERSFWLLTTKSERPYWDAPLNIGDVFVFGCETQGLPESLLEKHPDRCLTIPMVPGSVRSLNLSNSASIVLYEAFRRTRDKR